MSTEQVLTTIDDSATIKDDASETITMIDPLLIQKCRLCKQSKSKEHFLSKRGLAVTTCDVCRSNAKVLRDNKKADPSSLSDPSIVSNEIIICECGLLVPSVTAKKHLVSNLHHMRLKLIPFFTKHPGICEKLISKQSIDRFMLKIERARANFISLEEMDDLLAMNMNKHG
jgi:hypothetical protein